MPTDFRAVPRFFIMTALPATLGEADANVVDLSIRGARVQVVQPYAVGATLSFKLETGAGSVQTTATVTWCRMVALSLDDLEADRYLCGVAFEEEFPAVLDIVDDLLERELAMRIEDARSTERYSIIVPMSGSYGVQPSVRMLDVSIRGARIACDRPIAPGTCAPLRFRVGKKQIELSAVAVWCRASERRGGFETGMRIDHEESVLRQVIAQLCTQNQARIDLNSLRRKFDPMRGDATPGLLALV